MNLVMWHLSQVHPRKLKNHIALFRLYMAVQSCLRLEAKQFGLRFFRRLHPSPRISSTRKPYASASPLRWWKAVVVANGLQAAQAAPSSANKEALWIQQNIAWSNIEGRDIKINNPKPCLIRQSPLEKS